MFGHRLKMLRKQNRITQSELATLLDVTQQAVSKWESGVSSPDPAALAKIAECFNTTTDNLIGHDSEIQRAFMRRDFALVPIIGLVRAGYGSYAYDEPLGSEPADVKNPSEYFYLSVKGDSMAPFIRDGDLALVRKQPTLDNGDLGVVIYGDNESTLKIYKTSAGKVILEPFNKNYETLIISGDELENLYIFGKVVETKTKW